ncbi:MAG: hypothetical protein WDW36_008295 [Sanguina aurantia]
MCAATAAGLRAITLGFRMSGRSVGAGGLPSSGGTLLPVLATVRNKHNFSEHLERFANHHDLVTILFTDVVGFTSMSKSVPAASVMRFLSDLYSELDDLVDRHNVYKVETAGDCYIVAGGLLSYDDDGFLAVDLSTSQPLQASKHAANVFAFAKDMLVAARRVIMPHNGQPACLRVGIHSGPLVSGVIGTKMPKFALFGDTMNTSSRMESTSQPGCIHVSAVTAELLGPGVPLVSGRTTGAQRSRAPARQRQRRGGRWQQQFAAGPAQCRGLFAPVDQLHGAGVVFGQGRAVLDPVAVIEIQHATDVAHLAKVDMTADVAIEPALRRIAGHALLVGADVGQRLADMRFDDDRQRQVGQVHPAAHAVEPSVAPADEAVHRLAQVHHPAAADIFGVEFVAVADVISAAVGAFMDGVESKFHALQRLPGQPAQGGVVVAGNVGDVDAAPRHRGDFRQHRTVVGVPPVPAHQRFHVDDVTDQIKLFAAQLAQEVEQVARLAVGRAEMHVGDERAAAVKVRHDENSGRYRGISVGASGHRSMANRLQMASATSKLDWRTCTG